MGLRINFIIITLHQMTRTAKYNLTNWLILKSIKNSHLDLT